MKERSKKTYRLLFGIFTLSLMVACSSDDLKPEETEDGYVSTPKPLTVPTIFQRLLPPPIIPSDNLQTVEGIALGRKLFFDPILSGNGTQACASCHKPSNSFTDDTRVSIGIDGIEGTRNSMPIYNMA